MDLFSFQGSFAGTVLYHGMAITGQSLAVFTLLFFYLLSARKQEIQNYRDVLLTHVALPTLVSVVAAQSCLS